MAMPVASMREYAFGLVKARFKEASPVLPNTFVVGQNVEGEFTA